MLLSPTQPSGASSYCWWLQQLCTALTVLALGRTSALGVPPVSTAMAPPTGISLIVVSFSMDKGPTLLHSTEKRSVNRQAGSLPDQGRPCRRWTATRRLSTRSSDRRWWRVCRDRSPRARGHVVERWGATVSSTTRSPFWRSLLPSSGGSCERHGVGQRCAAWRTRRMTIAVASMR
jgi:hypothetical protein